MTAKETVQYNTPTNQCWPCSDIRNGSKTYSFPPCSSLSYPPTCTPSQLAQSPAGPPWTPVLVSPPHTLHPPAFDHTTPRHTTLQDGTCTLTTELSQQVWLTISVEAILYLATIWSCMYSVMVGRAIIRWGSEITSCWSFGQRDVFLVNTCLDSERS